MNGIVIGIFIIIIWILLVIFLRKRFEDKISLMGPILMLKTKRGIKFIKKISKNKFWRYYSKICVVVAYSLLIFSFAMILWEAYIAMYIPKTSAPSPIQALGIPGINPVIPITYGIVGLIVAIVVHEGAHGIMVAWQKLKIVSMGIALFIVPVGAFVEPDENELMKAKRYKRVKVFAAGPSTNIIVGLIFLIIFLSSLSAISPKYNGVVVMKEYVATPFKFGDVITKIDNITVKNSEDIYNINIKPATLADLTVYRDNKIINVKEKVGLYIIDVLDETPAEKSGIPKGSIIVSLDGTTIYNQKTFLNILKTKKAGENINITVFYNSSYRNYTIKLMDKYEYYKRQGVNMEEFKGQGFMGVSTSYMGLSLIGCSEIIKFIGDYSIQSPFNSFLKFISLPFLGFEPLPPNIQSLYSTPFPLFWEIVHYSYWIAWLNILVGLTNLLPAVPLDGGYIVRDALSKIFEKRKDGEKLADKLTTIFAFLVLFIIIWIFVIPRI